MSELTEDAVQPGWYRGDDGWSHRLPISDNEAILTCLHNAPLGLNKHQITKLIKALELKG